VVEDSPVDYTIYEFVCLTYACMIDASMLGIQFWLDGTKRLTRTRNDAHTRENIEKFHELEKSLATQNELLEKLVSTHTACS